MPTIECHCNTCGHRFEHLFFKGDHINPVCPRCKKQNVSTRDDPQRFMADPSMGSLLTGPPKGPS